MPPGTTQTILVLEGGTFLPSREVLDDWNIADAAGPLEAAAALTREAPALIVIHPAQRWHRTFISSLPDATRPAVLAVGQGEVSLDLADEWMADGATPQEVAARIHLSRARAGQRQLEALARFVARQCIPMSDSSAQHP